jgi:glycosyltransferase involved in cell wall biosynthesis
MSVPAPRVSVLLTTYNREPFVGEAIESVLAQTFTDFELLIVDDASTDGTVEIARRYADCDPRIRVVVNDRNLGQFANRNKAASLAVGEFLKYHDSDDVMYPHCLQVLVSSLEPYPAAGFALTRGTHWPGGAVPMLLTPRLSFEREYLGSGLFGCGPSGALFRRTAFAELGGFEDEGVPSD